MSNRGTESHGP